MKMMPALDTVAGDALFKFSTYSDELELVTSTNTFKPEN